MMIFLGLRSGGRTETIPHGQGLIARQFSYRQVAAAKFSRFVSIRWRRSSLGVGLAGFSGSAVGLDRAEAEVVRCRPSARR
jgi:hypothetical protein